MKNGFKGVGNSLDGLRKPGDGCEKKAPKAKTGMGFKGEGGHAVSYPGQSNSLPKK